MSMKFNENNDKKTISKTIDSINNNSSKEYEEIIIKLEEKDRNHIRVEQQLKL